MGTRSRAGATRLGDLDGDGDLDLLGTMQQPVDRHPPRIRAVERTPARANGKTRVRFAVSDRASSDVGPRLSEAVVELSGRAVIPARFVGGDLFQAELNVDEAVFRCRICAADAGGLRACSEEIEFGRGD